MAAETKGTDAAIREVMKRGLGVDQLFALPEAWRGDIALDTRPLRAREPRRIEARPQALPVRAWPRPAAAYALAYGDRVTTPRRVAERALAEVERLATLRPSMNISIAQDREATLRDADAATARWAAGKPRGPFDGVPFLVKDELDVAGLPTSLGVRCQPQPAMERDATLVARMREAGAVIVCKTVLTEWGMSPLGNNVNQPMPHNAHDVTKAPGGSSTGTGVGVALGVAPIGAGGDGGGSIRIPAALNGVFGIKPTFGRVSRAGDGFKGTVAHAGPIASSTADLSHFLDIVASAPDAADELTAWAPPPPAGGFGALSGAGVRGLRIGVDEADWRDASEPVAQACRDALRALEREGATLVDISLPIAHYASKVGYLTIGPESLAAHRREWIEQRELLGDDLRLVFAVLSGFTALEQLDAVRLRGGMRRELMQALAGVDVIAMPTTAITAPRYTEEDEKVSFSDPPALEGLVRYTFLCNLTGNPAGTVPVGVDAAGLPIGLQIVGDAWDEVQVLGVMAHLERMGVAAVKRPPGGIDLIG
ncbi:Aspartyl-tRNA(Asn) amidotransferase subunit A [Minicystis rosea]|nr:Aspartyl-tRNA(Asn) amidotransferase subunit A [Minicystis rosea]